MLQEKVMSKASETKYINIIDQKLGAQILSIPQTVIIHHLINLTLLMLSVQLSVET